MKKSAPRRPRRVARRPARRPRVRRTGNVSEYASLSEIRTLTPDGGGDFTVNRMYKLMDTSLSQFTRAQQVAKAYQHFRIKHISIKIKPTFDTYTFNNIQANGKPYLYYMIDKAGALPTNVTLEGLKVAGAKPRQLDEKPLLINWRPSVLEASMTAGGAGFAGQGAKYVMSPWLNTNANSVNPGAWVASTVDHLGVYWYADTITNTTPQQPYRVEVEVQFEFKKPFLAGLFGEFEAISATHAVINTSRDGVVDSRPDGDDNELIVP